jgi:hypothetical protein
MNNDDISPHHHANSKSSRQEPAMSDPELSDDAIEDIFAGHDAPAGHEGVANAFADLRRIADTSPAIRGPVAEYLANAPAPTSPPFIGEAAVPLQPTPLAPKRRRRPLAGLVTAAAVSVAALGIAHASGAVDVPGLPDSDEGGVVAAPAAAGSGNRGLSPAVDDHDGSDDAPDAAAQGSGNIELGTSDDGTASAHIEFGDLSASIRIENDNGELTVTIDVEGVSPECETAIESLEGATDESGLEAQLGPVEAACAGELDFLSPLDGNPAELGRLLDGLALELNLPENFDDFSELFEDFEGLPHFDAKEFGAFFDGDIDKYLEDFERFLEQIDLGDLQIPEGFDLPEGLNLPGGLNLSELFGELERSFGDLDGFDPGAFDFEGLNLDDLEIPKQLRDDIDRFFNELDLEDLDLPEEFGPRLDELFSHLEDLHVD